MIPRRYFLPIFFMLCFCVSLTLNDAVIKLLSTAGLSIFALVLVRTIFILILGSPILFMESFKADWALAKKEWFLLTLRGALLFLPVMIWLYLLKHVPLAQLFAVGSVSPILQMVMSAVFLKERIGIYKILGLVLGTVGTIVVIQPSAMGINPYLLVAVISSIAWAAAMTMTKPMSSRYSSMFLSYHLAIVFLPLAAMLSFGANFSVLSLNVIGLLGLLSVLVLGGYWALSRAFSAAPLSLMALFEYSAVIFSAILGYYFFKEIPTLATWAGSIMIVSGSLLAIVAPENSGQQGLYIK